MDVLQVNELVTYFKKNKKIIKAVDGVSFSVKQGETLAIVGESGSGKSVTSLSIMGLLSASSLERQTGEVLLNGVDLFQLNRKQWTAVRGKEISMIFQEPMTSLNPVLTIGEQITDVIQLHLNLNKKEANQHAVTMLGKVGFSDPERMLTEYPHRLSGGMRQRAMIAMAMSCSPKIVIADEPTTALDVTIQAQILELMKQISQTSSTSFLLITHDLGVVSELADRVVVMYAGEIVESATVNELFHQPLHPYTKGLIQSLPKLTGAIERLVPIQGNVPPPGVEIQGCRFASRCNQVMAICKEKKPDLRYHSENRQVRCWLYREEVEA